MIYVELLVERSVLDREIKRMQAIGVRVVAKRDSENGIYVTFGIPRQIGFGL